MTGQVRARLTLALCVILCAANTASGSDTDRHGRQSRDLAADDADSLHRRQAPPRHTGNAQPRHVLVGNQQVSAFLPGGRFKRFLYNQKRENSPISVVVTPCSGHLDGIITFYPDKVREGGKDSLVVQRLQGPDQVIYTERRGERGSYDINITALSDTYVHFLVADEDLAGLSALQTSVKVKNRPQGRAEVSWAPAAFGGQSLHYCLVTSPDTHFSTVCGALSSKFGLRPPGGLEARRRRAQVAPQSRRRPSLGDSSIVVGCVGRQTLYELHELNPGMAYRVAVFGQYRSVSFRYGFQDFKYGGESRRSMIVRHSDVTHLRLTTSRPKSRLLLRFSRRAAASSGGLHYYVTSCGSALRLRVLRGRRNPVQIQAAEVTAVGLFAGHLNGTMGWYQFDLEALDGSTSVELQATWRRRRLQLARLPNQPTVKTISRRRSLKLELECGQMGITMARSRGRRLHYCVMLEEDRSGRQSRFFKHPSVCGLDIRLKHSPANYTVCGASKELRRGKRVEVVFSELPPGQTYVVRAMVKPKGGRFLPYHLSQVTVPECVEDKPEEVTDTNDVILKQSFKRPLSELWSNVDRETLTEAMETNANELGVQ